MKKIILISIALIAFGCSAMAQKGVLTHNTFSFQNGNTYVAYTPTKADTITKNQDTLDFTVNLNNAWSCKYAIGVRLDTNAGKDTTVRVLLFGKNFTGEAWGTALDSDILKANIHNQELVASIHDITGIAKTQI